ncbi:hypothetical protein [Moorena sp. SIO4G3]|nr:hypothetical protein [Moorena sp. SIO4G3]
MRYTLFFPCSQIRCSQIRCSLLPAPYSLLPNPYKIVTAHV